MRKVIWGINLTLDGFIDHEKGLADEELHQYWTDFFNNVDVILFGRKMYELLVDYWPTAPSDTSLPKEMIDFAHAINRLPKIVYSRTLEKVEWNATLEREIDPEEIRRLKQQPGKGISISGREIAQKLMEHNLIDEYQFLVQPIILGSGTPLFRDLHEKYQLKLFDTKTFRSGVVCHYYHPERNG